MRLLLIAVVGAWAYLGLGSAPVLAQSFDDTEVQLRVRQAAAAVAAQQREVEDLRKALAAERGRTVATEDERDLNQATIATLETKLRSAEAKLHRYEAALGAAQEERRKGLAAESDKRRRDDLERERADEQRQKAVEERRRSDELDRLRAEEARQKAEEERRRAEALRQQQALRPRAERSAPVQQSADYLAEVKRQEEQFRAELRRQEEQYRAEVLHQMQEYRRQLQEFAGSSTYATPPDYLAEGERHLRRYQAEAERQLAQFLDQANLQLLEYLRQAQQNADPTAYAPGIYAPGIYAPSAGYAPAPPYR